MCGLVRIIGFFATFLWQITSMIANVCRSLCKVLGFCASENALKKSKTLTVPGPYKEVMDANEKIWSFTHV